MPPVWAWLWDRAGPKFVKSRNGLGLLGWLSGLSVDGFGGWSGGKREVGI